MYVVAFHHCWKMTNQFGLYRYCFVQISQAPLIYLHYNCVYSDRKFTLSSSEIIISPSWSNYTANGANLNSSNRCLRCLVGGSDPRIDIITERLGGFQTKWTSNQNQMNLVLSRLSKTERNGKKKKKKKKGSAFGTWAPNALYSQLIIFLQLSPLFTS